MVRPIRWIQRKIELVASHASSWNRNRKFGIDKYFVVDNTVTDPDSGLFPVRLIKGKFAGTLYSYGIIHIVGDDQPALKFKVNVLEQGKIPANPKDPEFMEITAEVLLVLMQEAYMNKKGDDLLEKESLDSAFDDGEYFE